MCTAYTDAITSAYLSQQAYVFCHWLQEIHKRHLTYAVAATLSNNDESIQIYINSQPIIHKKRYH